MSPSNFDAAFGHAHGWIQNSAGYLNPWTWVVNWSGARPVITLKSDNRKIEKVGTV